MSIYTEGAGYWLKETPGLSPVGPGPKLFTFFGSGLRAQKNVCLQLPNHYGVDIHLSQWPKH
jgi:hypothetical protein